MQAGIHLVKTVIFLFFIGCFGATVKAYGTVQSNQDKIGQVIVATGLVEITNNKHDLPTPAKRRAEVTQNSTLKTSSGRSKATIRLLDGSLVQMVKNSQITIDSFVYNPALKANATIEITLAKGDVRTIVGQQPNKGRTLIKTDLASVSVEDGHVEIAIKGQRTYLAVWAGEAEVKNNKGDKVASKKVGPGTKHSFAVFKSNGDVMLLPQPPSVFLN